MRRHQATSLAASSRLCRFLLLSSIGAEASGRGQRSADEGARLVQVALGPAGVGEFSSAAGPQPQEDTPSHRRRAAGANRKTEEEDVAVVQRSGRTLRRDLRSGTGNDGQEVEQDENYEEQSVLDPSKADPVQSSSLSTGSKTVRSSDQYDVRVGRSSTATEQSQTHSRGPASDSSAEVGVQIPWWPFASVSEVFRQLLHRRSIPATKSQLLQEHQLQAEGRRFSSSTTERSFATVSAVCDNNGTPNGGPTWRKNNLPYNVRLPCDSDLPDIEESVEVHCRWEAVNKDVHTNCEASCQAYMLNCLGLAPRDTVREEHTGWSGLYRDELYDTMCTDTCKNSLPDFGTNCPDGAAGSGINDGIYTANEIRVRPEDVFSYFWKIAIQGRPRK